jgi:hypothetical protein
MRTPKKRLKRTTAANRKAIMALNEAGFSTLRIAQKLKISQPTGSWAIILYKELGNSGDRT